MSNRVKDVFVMQKVQPALLGLCYVVETVKIHLIKLICMIETDNFLGKKIIKESRTNLLPLIK